MLKTKLAAKLHSITLTGSDLHYEGSIALDKNYLDASGMEPFERVDIYNITNGQRFSTYILEAPAGSETVMVNGAAARLVQKGDQVIVCAYRHYGPDEYQGPRVLLFGKKNKFKIQK